VNRPWTLGQDKPDDSVPAYETEGKFKVFYHATEPENVDRILLDGLRAPVYMMNGRSTVNVVQRSTSATYPGGYQVLLRIKLPKDWPLVQDEASETPQFVKSLVVIPPSDITVDNRHWP